MTAEVLAVDAEYDQLDRLVRAVYSDGTVVQYTYDGAGNRLSKTVTVPGLEVVLAVRDDGRDPGVWLDNGGAPVLVGRVLAAGTTNRVFTLLNAGNVNLAGLNLTLEADEPSAWSASFFPPILLPPGSSQPFTVNFTPGADGTSTALVRVSTGSPGVLPFVVQLQGTRVSGLYWSWMAQEGYLQHPDAQDTGDVNGNLVANFVEYAHGIKPSQGHPHEIHWEGSNITSNGYTYAVLWGEGDHARLGLTYVRRKDADARGISYLPMFGSTPNSMSPAVTTPILRATNDAFEVFTIIDDLAYLHHPRRFGKVDVRLIPETPIPDLITTTGPLFIARSFHQATLLPGDKVLVTGGFGSDYFLAAELYEAASGIWSPAGSLAIGRVGHTATLLSNGKVLVVGGNNGESFHSGAELFDSATGTWSPTGSLATGRSNHTATLLQNGKVLVVGGAALHQLYASAEIYDPNTGIWSATGALAAGRTLHSATLLPDGRVLVAGGHNDAVGNLASSEIYDPTGGVWSPSGSLSTARNSHSATLLHNGYVLVAAGSDGFGNLTTTELFNPATGTWSLTGSLSVEHLGHSATLLTNGMVVVTGGVGSTIGYDDLMMTPIYDYASPVERYDPIGGNWSTIDGLRTRRHYHTATLLPDGKLLVAGGVSTNGTISSAELLELPPEN